TYRSIRLRNSLGEESRSFRSGASEAASGGFCPLSGYALVFAVKTRPPLKATTAIKHAAILNFRFNISVLSISPPLCGGERRPTVARRNSDNDKIISPRLKLSCKYPRRLVPAYAVHYPNG